MLKDVSLILKKIAYKENLTVEEARKALNTIGGEDIITDPNNSDGLYFLALTFGIMAKGPTSDELYGFVLSLSDNSIKFNPKIKPDRITDISGSGGDSIKTFNIGTTASFVIAAAGVAVAKQAARAFTGVTGSVDIFRELGVDFLNERDPLRVESCLEKVGIAAFYTPAFTKGFKNRVDFVTKLKAIGLTYPTPWHLVSWVYSPVKMGSRVYGVFSEKYLMVLAELFIKLGYKRGMVVHGVDGIDELSVVGPTKIAEFNNGKISEYTIEPKDVGLKRYSIDKIMGGSADENKIDFFRILYGVEKGAKRDMVVLNAAASLYSAGKAANLKEGVRLADSMIKEGKSASKLEEFVAFMKAQESLEKWKQKAGI